MVPDAVLCGEKSTVETSSEQATLLLITPLVDSSLVSLLEKSVAVVMGVMMGLLGYFHVNSSYTTEK